MEQGADEEIRVAISPTRCAFPRAPRALARTFYLEIFINNSASFQSVQFSSVQSVKFPFPLLTELN